MRHCVICSDSCYTNLTTILGIKLLKNKCFVILFGKYAQKHVFRKDSIGCLGRVTMFCWCLYMYECSFAKIGCWRREVGVSFG